MRQICVRFLKNIRVEFTKCYQTLKRKRDLLKCII